MEEQEKLQTWGVKCERPFVRVVRNVNGILAALLSRCFLHGRVARRRLIEDEEEEREAEFILAAQRSLSLSLSLSLSRQRRRLHRKRLRRRSVMHFRGSSFPPLTLSLQILLLRRRQRRGRQKGSPHPPIASPRGVGGKAFRRGTRGENRRAKVHFSFSSRGQVERCPPPLRSVRRLPALRRFSHIEYWFGTYLNFPDMTI